MPIERFASGWRRALPGETLTALGGTPAALGATPAALGAAAARGLPPAALSRTNWFLAAVRWKSM